MEFLRLALIYGPGCARIFALRKRLPAFPGPAMQRRSDLGKRSGRCRFRPLGPSATSHRLLLTLGFLNLLLLSGRYDRVTEIQDRAERGDKPVAVGFHPPIAAVRQAGQES